jgi:hypothetical protein
MNVQILIAMKTVCKLNPDEMDYYSNDHDTLLIYNFLNKKYEHWQKFSLHVTHTHTSSMRFKTNLFPSKTLKNLSSLIEKSIFSH